MDTSSLRGLAVLPLLLVACANTVAPAAPAVDASAPDAPSAPDVPSATPCERSFILAAGARVSLATILPIDGGFAMAWVLADTGTIVARVSDDDLTSITPVGVPLELPSRGVAPDSVSLAFSGDTGVIAAGTSLHFINRRAGTLSLTNTHDLSPRVARGAWASGSTTFNVVTSDTSLIFANAASMSDSTPNDASVDPIGAGASVMTAGVGGGYRALEDVGGRLRMRYFIIGHGSALQVRDEAGEGASASPVLFTGEGYHRLVYRGDREVDVALEQRDFSSLELSAPPTVLHAAAARNVTSGAVAPAGDELFLTWAARSGSSGYNVSLQAQWGVRGGRAEVFRSTVDRSLRVFAAVVDASGARAWVIFGEPAAEGGYQLRGQCVTR